MGDWTSLLLTPSASIPFPSIKHFQRIFRLFAVITVQWDSLN